MFGEDSISASKYSGVADGWESDVPKSSSAVEELVSRCAGSCLGSVACATRILSSGGFPVDCDSNVPGSRYSWVWHLRRVPRQEQQFLRW